MILFFAPPTNAQEFTPLWSHTFGGPHADRGEAVAADALNNVYVSGTFNTNTGDDDLLILKYAPDGTLLWKRAWDFLNIEVAFGLSVSADNQSLIVSGGPHNGINLADALVMKFSAITGDLLWARDWVLAWSPVIKNTLDATGNIYVAGDTTAGPPPYNVLLLKYDPNGNLIYSKALDSGQSDVGGPIALDASGNLYLSSRSASDSSSTPPLSSAPDSNPFHRRIYLYKADSLTGSVLWVRKWDAGLDSHDRDVRTDKDGNIYISGVLRNPLAFTYNALLLKFDPNGNLIWQRIWDSGFDDNAASLSFDSSGNIRLAGATNATGQYRPLILTFNPDGTIISSAVWAGSSLALANSIAIDSQNNILLTGEAPNNIGSMQTISGSVSDPGGTILALSGASHNVTGTLLSPQGTLYTPTGVQDSGGGGPDVMVMRVAPGVILDVPYFDQRAGPWGPKEYDSAEQWAPKLTPPASSTIARWGCLLSSAAMVLRFHGITTLPNCSGNACPALEGLDVNPDTLNQWLLKEPGGYKNNGDVNLGAMETLSRLAGKPLDYSLPLSWNPVTLENEIKANRPAIVELDLANIGFPKDTHFIVTKGILTKPSASTTFIINDPDLRYATSLDPYGKNHKSIRKFATTTTDLSSTFISITPSLNFLVIDPQGRKSGFDSVMNAIVDEIPESLYFFQSPLADDAETGARNSPGSQDFLLERPIPGTYTIQVQGTTTQSYRIAIYTHDRNAHPFFVEPEHIISPDTPQTYFLAYSPEPGFPVKTELVVKIDVKPDDENNNDKDDDENEENIINCRNRRGVIPVATLTTAVFDATTVDPDTVRFGPKGASEIHRDRKGKAKRHLEDVDDDGDLDLLLHFRFGDTGIKCGDTLATLTGKTFDGFDITGSDSIKTVQPKKLNILLQELSEVLSQLAAILKTR